MNPTDDLESALQRARMGDNKVLGDAVMDLRAQVAAIAKERDEQKKQAEYGWQRAAENDAAYAQALQDRDFYKQLVETAKKLLMRIEAERAKAAGDAREITAKELIAWVTKHKANPSNSLRWKAIYEEDVDSMEGYLDAIEAERAKASREAQSLQPEAKPGNVKILIDALESIAINEDRSNLDGDTVKETLEQCNNMAEEALEDYRKSAPVEED